VGKLVGLEEEAAVAATEGSYRGIAVVKAGAADGGVELRGFRDGHELRARGAGIVEIEAEEAGRVALAESAEECGVGGEAEPPLGDERCAY
jgi:hypothetical protein